MDHVITSAHALLRDDSGQDLTEYGLLASLIAILAIVALGDLGVLIGGLWDDIVLQLATVL
jgi:Flp pilus assembly pilin Flp